MSIPSTPPSALLSSPGFVPVGVAQSRIQNWGLISSSFLDLRIVLIAVPTMSLEAGLANLGQLKPGSDDTLLDHGTGQARGPSLVKSTITVGDRVEGIVHHHVELIVCKRGLHVAVVGVLRPGSIREVQDQGV